MRDNDDVYSDFMFPDPVVVESKYRKPKGTVKMHFEIQMQVEPVQSSCLREDPKPVASSSHLREDPKPVPISSKMREDPRLPSMKMPSMWSGPSSSWKECHGNMITVVPPPAKRPRPPDSAPLDKLKVYVSSLPFWIKKFNLSEYILEYAGIAVDTAGIYLLLENRDKTWYQSTAAMVPTTSEEDSLKIIESIDGWPLHIHGQKITLHPMRAKFANRSKMVTINIAGTTKKSAPQVVPPPSKPPPSKRPQRSVSACISKGREPRLWVQDEDVNPASAAAKLTGKVKEEQFSDDDVDGVAFDPYLEPPSVAVKLEYDRV